MSRKIRKVTIGDNPFAGGQAFLVGRPPMKESMYLISEIIEDSNALILSGISRFNVYISEKGGEHFLWKAFERVPILIEYYLPDDKDDQRYP